MRLLIVIVGSLALIVLATALLTVSPEPAKLMVDGPKRAAANPIAMPEAGEARSASPARMKQFPPEHVDSCDFSAYQPTRISDWLPAGVVETARPTYPAEARLKGIAGTVRVFVLINRQGHVQKVCSIGPSELRSSAEAAAVEWRFKRPTINEGIDPFGYIQETLTFNFVSDQRQPSAPADDPAVVAASLCAVVKSPWSFDGKRVRLAAEFVSDGMHTSLLVDDRCQLGITPYDSDQGQKQSELDALDRALEQGMAGTSDKTITAVFIGVFAYQPKTVKEPRVLYIQRVMDLKVSPRGR